MKKTILLVCSLLLLLVIPAAFGKFSPKHHILHQKIQLDDGTKFKLILGNKTYELQMYNLSYVPASTEKSKTEMPVNIYQSNTLNVNLRTSKIDQELMDWLLDPEQSPKDGQIIAYDADTNKPIRTITFTGAKTASYNENNNSGFYNLNNQLTGFALRYKTISIKFN
jgi:hypothetical protein